MCDKAVDAFLPTLKFLPDWFVTSKMNEKLDDTLFSNNDITFVNENSNHVTFFSDKMGILSKDLNNINLDDINFDKDDPETIIFVRLMAWHNRFKQRKAFKKEISKELMSVRWQDWCVPEDKKTKNKKELKPFLNDEK